MDSSSAAEARAFIFHSFGTCRLSSSVFNERNKKRFSLLFSLFFLFFVLFLSFATEEIEFLHPKKTGKYRRADAHRLSLLDRSNSLRERSERDATVRPSDDSATATKLVGTECLFTFHNSERVAARTGGREKREKRGK
jgi:hypothetical protein